MENLSHKQSVLFYGTPVFHGENCVEENVGLFMPWNEKSL